MKFREWLEEREQDPAFQAATAEMAAEDAIIGAAFDDDLGGIVQPDERMQWLGIYALGYAAGVDRARAVAKEELAKEKPEGES